MRRIYQHGEFIDREAIIEAVARTIQELAEHGVVTPDQRIRYFLDHTLSGKTWLLFELQQRFLAQPRVYPVHIPLNLFLKLWPLTNGQIPADPTHVKIDLLTGNIIRILGRRISRYRDVPANFYYDKDASLYGLSLRLIEDVQALEEKGAVVLLFDELGMLSQQMLDSLEDRLLAYLIRENYVSLIFAGRNFRHRWKNMDLIPPEDPLLIQLPVMVEDDTRRQLARQAPGKVVFTGPIHELSGGVPGITYMIAQASPAAPLSAQDEIKILEKLIHEILDTLKPGLLPYLMALSILKGFSGDLEEVEPLFKLQDVYFKRTGKMDYQKKLKEINEAQVGTGRLVSWNKLQKIYMLDEQVRRLLEMLLIRQSLPLAIQLHQKACDLYREWAPDSSDPGYWLEKAGYHAACVDSLLP